MRQKQVRLSVALGTAALLSGWATGCTVPTPPVTTVWQKLGVPQAAAGLRDTLTNRRGNRPGLERKPPLLRIADPANLESPIPAIKVAANVKAAEDLKAQKIKAIKYLAEIGCGCYDKDGAIAAAFLDALKDCTPEVRIAAAEAITTAAGTCGCCYDGCTPTCCTKEVVKRLYDMAYGEEEGCPIEPSAEVRAAAARALRACSAVPHLAEALAESQPAPETPPALGEQREAFEELEAPEGEVDVDVNVEGDADVDVDVDTDDDLDAGAMVPSAPAATVAETPTIGLNAPISYVDYNATQSAAEALYDSYEPSNGLVGVGLGERTGGQIIADVTRSREVANPENMVAAQVTSTDHQGNVTLAFDAAYDLTPGMKVLLLTEERVLVHAEVAGVQGEIVDFSLASGAAKMIIADQQVRVGLVGQ